MYAKIYQNILFPFYETILRWRKTLLYLKELEKSQWLSEKQLRKIQLEKLKALLKHAYENVPYYKEIFERLGLQPKDIENFEDFRKFPLLTKQDIRNNQEKLTANNYSKKKVFNTATGGSTGVPLQLKLDHNNYEWRQAAAKRVYGWAGCKDGEKTVFIWGGSVGKVSRIKKLKHSIDEWLKRHKIYNTFYFTKDVMTKCIKEINCYKPKFIIGYTMPLYNFAKFIKENDRKVWSPHSIIVAAEKLFSYQRKLIEEIFGCPVFETYGCREVTSIAGECEEHNGMHINMENIYLEVIKDDKPAEAGEPGEMLITDLTNYCMPLIGYKNEDLGGISNRSCKCGRGLKLLERIEGRLLDTVKTIDGKIVPGEFFPHLMKEFEEIDKFQIVQESLDKLVIKIVKKKNFSNNRLEYIKREVSKVMGNKITTEFNFVNELPLTPSGKFRVVVSQIERKI